MNYANLPDEIILRHISQGHNAALGEFYDRYSRLVFSIAFNATGNSHLAEDITQDVFISVWQKAASYRGSRGRVATWISSITRYRTIDTLRRLSVRPEGNRIEPRWENALEQHAEIDIEKEVAATQNRERVRMALGQLPENQRVALAYAFFLGFSHSEISQTLDIPLGTVKTRIRLGMQKLRQLLTIPNGELEI